MSRALAVGTFDGVHVGHRRIFTLLQELSNEPTVFTFSNHPADVLHHTEKQLVMHSDHKSFLISNMGINVIMEPFTQALSQLTAEEFLARFSFDHLILGRHAAFGRQRMGGKLELERLGRRMGFTVHDVEPVEHEGRQVSSSYIRDVIREGNLELLSCLLGRPYSIRGAVIHGMCRRLGFPTANIAISKLCLPPTGVYQVRVGSYNGIANLGYAPTFGHRGVYLEVHLFDFEGDLYGHMLDVVFVRFIRPEKKFESHTALVQQIHEDIDSVRHAAQAG